MFITALVLLQGSWSPPVPSGRKPLPSYKGVEFRLANEGIGQRGMLINLTRRNLIWNAPVFLQASFAQPIGGGKIYSDRLWKTWRYSTMFTACPAPLRLKATKNVMLQRSDIARRLGLPPGRYHAWQIIYPAFNTDSWMVSNPVVIDAP